MNESNDFEMEPYTPDELHGYIALITHAQIHNSWTMVKQIKQTLIDRALFEHLAQLRDIEKAVNIVVPKQALLFYYLP